MGVILFIMVQGIFPFKEARKEEYFYNLLLSGQIDTYFSKVNGAGLSQEFKSLILGLFEYDGEKRPSLEDIRNHPFLNKPGFDYEATRQQLLSAVRAKQAPAATQADMPM